MREVTCAIWVWRHGSISYELCRDEAEAVSWALSIAEDGSGSVAGIQYDDGRFVDREDWDAYKAEDRRRTEEMFRQIAEERSRPRPPIRHVKPPFETERPRTVAVIGDAPDWLGG